MSKRRRTASSWLPNLLEKSYKFLKLLEIGEGHSRGPGGAKVMQGKESVTGSPRVVPYLLAVPRPVITPDQTPLP
jgi:hypothetical protein